MVRKASAGKFEEVSRRQGARDFMAFMKLCLSVSSWCIDLSHLPLAGRELSLSPHALRSVPCLNLQQKTNKKRPLILSNSYHLKIRSLQILLSCYNWYSSSFSFFTILRAERFAAPLTPAVATPRRKVLIFSASSLCSWSSEANLLNISLLPTECKFHFPF